MRALAFILALAAAAPAVELPVSGTTITGSAQAIDPVGRKRPVVVVFWASWCGNCVREMPAVRRFAAAAGERCDVVSCSIDTRPEAARDSATRNQLGYPVILDGEMAIAGRFAVASTPTLVLLGADGAELSRGRTLAQLGEALTRIGIAVQ
jgi:thiol-disulfide isomerase/thioredoxin